MKRLLPLVLITLLACNQDQDNADSKNKNGLITYRRKNGTIYQETNYKNNVKEGIEKTYYLKGNKVKKEIPFLHGEIHGVVKHYFEDGKIYQLISYKAGKKDGLHKVYYKSGQLKYQLSYRSGEPGSDLVEYTESGEVIKQSVPEIIVGSAEKSGSNGEYVLRLKLSNNWKSVQFYEGSLLEGKYLNNDMLPFKTENGIGEYTCYVPSGGEIRNKVNFVAVIKTRMGNPLMVQKSHNLVVRNPV